MSEIFDLAIQLGEGLQVAHESDIIHRDIKPQNIMLSSKGHVKITDFGLVRWKEASTLTQSGTYMGTPHYMSPEQTEGKSVDSRSDIFSVGVVIYELVAGRLPFEGEHAAAISYSVVHDQPEPLARYKTHVPASLQQIVDKCLRKNVEERYQTCADLVADLKRAKRLLESAATAEPDGDGPTNQSQSSGRSWVVDAGTAVVIAILAILYLQPWATDENARGMAATGAILAVKPFVNKGAPEDSEFAGGITDAIKTSLTKIKGLRMLPIANDQQYEDSTLHLKQIARQSGATYFVDGTIRYDKDSAQVRVRITAELMNLTDGLVLWRDSYERDLTQAFEIQADIAEHVANELGLTLFGYERQDLADRSTDKPAH